LGEPSSSRRGIKKQADAAGAAFRALRPRQQHHDFRVGIGAEPFLARQPPVIAFLNRRDVVSLPTSEPPSFSVMN
jgi:hypothetical protein